MSERAAFFQAIRESPDDDTPRLVYADWLEENGDLPHSALIRVQIDQTRMLDPEEPRTDEYDARWQELARREQMLLDGMTGLRPGQASLRQRFRQLFNGAMPNVTRWLRQEGIQRGFADRIEPCDGDWWATNGDKVLDLMPIRAVAFWTPPRWTIRGNRFLFATDSRGEAFDVPAGEGIEHLLAACCRRWPGVKFEQLPDGGHPEVIAGPYQYNASGRAERISRVPRIGQGR